MNPRTRRCRAAPRLDAPRGGRHEAGIDPRVAPAPWRVASKTKPLALPPGPPAAARGVSASGRRFSDGAHATRFGGGTCPWSVLPDVRSVSWLAGPTNRRAFPGPCPSGVCDVRHRSQSPGGRGFSPLSRKSDASDSVNLPDGDGRCNSPVGAAPYSPSSIVSTSKTALIIFFHCFSSWLKSPLMGMSNRNTISVFFFR